MFTGIIETIGTITGSSAVPGGRRLRVAVGSVIAAETSLGASIAVHGVCLTVSNVAADSVEFDVVSQTLDTSTLGTKPLGSRVNIERALRADGRLDGHFVQGHVDGSGTIARIESTAREWVCWVRPQPHLLPLLVPKGSVAIDGVSLTIAHVGNGEFSVALIPTTLNETTMETLRTGDKVNIESDLIVRTIMHRLSNVSPGKSLSLETLRESGFA